MIASSVRLRIELAYQHFSDDDLTRLTNKIESLFPDRLSIGLITNDKIPDLVSIYISILLTLLMKGHKPILHDISVIRDKKTSSESYIACIPTAPNIVTPIDIAVKATSAIISLVIEGSDYKKAQSLKEKAIERLVGQFPHGRNTFHMIEYAWRKRIPCLHLVGNIFQLGWGSKSSTFDSTISDRTTSSSVMLAKNKFLSNILLKNAGIPVAKQFVVTKMEDAFDAAKKLGLPVVLKPADADGGVGVIAGIRTTEDFRKAFLTISRKYKRILVEEYVFGDDFRIHICNYQVYRVVQRIAAHVVGDGVSSIDNLIERHNEHALTGLLSAAGSTIKPIKVDDELQQWLIAQHSTLGSVPDKGSSIRLKGAANVNTGGITTYPKQVHKDNLSLAIRVARLLRLDIAGVDLIIPDIKKSWKTQKTIICEVNAQPQIAEAKIPFIVDQIVRGTGRIPIVFFLGDDKNTTWFNIFRDKWRLTKCDLKLGVVYSSGIWLEDECIIPRNRSTYSDTLCLLKDVNIEGLIIFINDTSSLREGLPVDQIDLLIVDQYEREELAQFQKKWFSIYSKMAKEIVKTNHTREVNFADQIQLPSLTSEQITDLAIRTLTNSMT